MDLHDPTMQHDGRTLAAIVLLAFLDIFESGSGAWSYHIEGAKKLLKNRPENGPGQGILDDLDAFALDGCLMYESVLCLQRKVLADHIEWKSWDQP